MNKIVKVEMIRIFESASKTFFVEIVEEDIVKIYVSCQSYFTGPQNHFTRVTLKGDVKRRDSKK